MRINTLIALTLLLGACGKITSTPIPDGIASGGDGASNPETAELPANSLDATLLEDPDTQNLTVTIPAKKSYNPTLFEDGWAFIPKTVQLILPEYLPVTGGRSGNHLAIVTIDRTREMSLTCIYVGEGSNTPAEYGTSARPYRFSFCVDKSVSVTPANRASIESSAQNILNRIDRSTVSLTLNRSDRISVQVNNSNRNGSLNIQGKVEFSAELKF